MTPEQLRALEWIRDNDHTRSQWLVDGKRPRARLSPDAWNQIELSGDMGSIRIPSVVWDGIRDLVTAAPFEDRRRLFKLTDVGSQVVAAARFA
jgi:hypothetical protein